MKRFKNLVFLFILFLTTVAFAQENIFYIKDVDKAPTLDFCVSKT